jgi:hypothetical protein
MLMFIPRGRTRKYQPLDRQKLGALKEMGRARSGWDRDTPVAPVDSSPDDLDDKRSLHLQGQPDLPSSDEEGARTHPPTMSCANLSRTWWRRNLVSALCSTLPLPLRLHRAVGEQLRLEMEAGRGRARNAMGRTANDIARLGSLEGALLRPTPRHPFPALALATSPRRASCPASLHPGVAVPRVPLPPWPAQSRRPFVAPPVRWRSCSHRPSSLMTHVVITCLRSVLAVRCSGVPMRSEVSRREVPFDHEKRKLAGSKKLHLRGNCDRGRLASRSQCRGPGALARSVKRWCRRGGPDELRDLTRTDRFCGRTETRDEKIRVDVRESPREPFILLGCLAAFRKGVDRAPDG